MTVKNTFVDVVAPGMQDSERVTIKKSASDSDLSRSSGEDKIKFWLPSLSSQSSNSKSNSGSNSGVQAAPQAGPVDASTLGLRASAPSTLGFQGHAPAPAAQLPMSSAFGSAFGGAFCGGWPAFRGQASIPDPPLAAARRNMDPPLAARQPLLQNDGLALIELLHRETHLPVSELQALHTQGLLSKIPRNDRGEISSIGSIGHATNECSPCIFWFKKSCAKGLHCDYCHFQHKGQRNKRIRPSKKTRMQMRSAAPRADSEDEEGGEDFSEFQDKPMYLSTKQSL